MSVEKVQIGGWFFEYDEKNRQLLVGQGAAEGSQEVGAMMEGAQPEDWQEFVERCQNGDVEVEAG